MKIKKIYHKRNLQIVADIVRWFGTLVFIGLLGYVSSAYPQEEVDPYLIKYLYQHPERFHFALSPNGEYVAYFKVKNNQKVIRIFSIEKQREVKDFIFKGSQVEVFAWVNNETIIYSSAGTIYLLNIGSNENRVLAKAKTGVFFSRGDIRRNYRFWRVASLALNDDSRIVLGSFDYRGYEDLYVADINSGDLRKIQDGGKEKIYHWFLNWQGEPRVGLTSKRKSNYIKIVNKQGKARKAKVHIQGKRYPLVYSAKSAVFDDRVYVVSLSNRENIIYLFENVTGDRYKFVSYDIEQKAIDEVLVSDDKYDVGNDSSRTQLLTDYDGSLLGIRYDRDKRVTRWFNREFSVFQQFLNEKFKNHIVEIYDWSKDRKKIMAWIYNHDSPGTVYIFDSDEKSIVSVTDFKVGTRNQSFADVDYVSFLTRDNVSIDAYLSLPKDYEKGSPIPFVVIPHGGPWARDTYGFTPDDHYLAAYGYGVLRLNFRGSTGYGREFLLGGIKNLATTMIEDIADGTKWLVEQGIADKEKIYIMGASYGGYAALMSAVKYPDLYKGIVSDSAPLDWLEMFEEYAKSKNHYGRAFWKIALGDPDRERKRLIGESPINLLDKINLPVLLVHGKGDEIVPVSQLNKTIGKLENSTKEHFYYKIYQNEAHGILGRNNRHELMGMALELFETGAINQVPRKGLNGGVDVLVKKLNGLETKDFPVINRGDSLTTWTSPTGLINIHYDDNHWKEIENNESLQVHRFELIGTSVSADVKKFKPELSNYEMVLRSWLDELIGIYPYVSISELEYRWINQRRYLTMTASLSESFKSKKEEVVFGVFAKNDRNIIEGVQINSHTYDFDKYKSLIYQFVAGVDVSFPETESQ